MLDLLDLNKDMDIGFIDIQHIYFGLTGYNNFLNMITLLNRICSTTTTTTAATTTTTTTTTTTLLQQNVLWALTLIKKTLVYNKH